MKRGLTGRYQVEKHGDEIVRAFIPLPLPPKPGLRIDPSLAEEINQVHISLGRLDSISALLPNINLFLYMYIRKEAVLSSQIEGTQSSLSDLLLFELEGAEGVPLDDVVEVSNYVAAMEHGLRRLRGGFPLSNRLIREVHGILLSRGRGADKEPGQFRRSQNWIQGTRPGNALYVPTPPEHVGEAMGELEKFMNDVPIETPTLVKAALTHVQFETIHPFLDGNGRIGRLLITLLFCHEGILRQPLLYLSLYFKQNRTKYFELLMKVRTDGDWEDWIRFFAVGIRRMAEGAVSTARRLNDIGERDQAKICGFGRRSGSALRVHKALQERPIANAAFLSKRTKLSIPAVTGALAALQDAGLIREITDKKRFRVYAYDEYLGLLKKGTELRT